MVNRTYNQWGEYSEIRTEIMAPVAIANTVTKLDNTTTLYQGTDVIVATLQKFGTLRTDWYMQPAFELTTDCGTSLNATILSNYIVFSPPFADVTGTCNSTFSILQPDGTAMVPTVENNTSVFKMYNPWLDTATYTLRIDNSNCASTSLQALAVSTNPVIENICFNSYYCPDFPEPACSQEYLTCSHFTNICHDYYYNQMYCQYRYKFGMGYWYCPRGNDCVVESFYYPAAYYPAPENVYFPATAATKVDVPFVPSENMPFFFGYYGSSANQTYYGSSDNQTYYAKILYA